MSIENVTSTKLDNNYTQIEIKNKNSDKKRYFIVPNNKVDSFIPTYRKTDKHNSIVTNTTFAGATLAGVFLSGLVTNRYMKNTPVKWIVNTCAGIVAATLSFSGIDKYLENKENKLLKQFQAKDITSEMNN